MTEKDLQQLVVDLCKWLRYPTYHTYDSRRSAPGFPDLVIVVPGEKVMYRELKTDKGKLTPTQEQWQQALGEAGADVGVWRPADWPDRIRAELVQSVHPLH